MRIRNISGTGFGIVVATVAGVFVAASIASRPHVRPELASLRVGTIVCTENPNATQGFTACTQSGVACSDHGTSQACAAGWQNGCPSETTEGTNPGGGSSRWQGHVGCSNYFPYGTCRWTSNGQGGFHCVQQSTSGNHWCPGGRIVGATSEAQCESQSDPSVNPPPQ